MAATKSVRCVAIGVLAVAAGCTSANEADPAPTPTTAAPETTVDGGCTVTVANYGPVPEGYAEVAGDVVWVDGPAGIAVLMYAGTSGATTIGTDGAMGPGRNTKILWISNDEPGAMTLTATKVETGAELVLATHDAGTNFPSTPVLPSEGCWKLSVTNADGVIASVLVRAETMG
ncbi:hypothetical protein EK0264_07000 [Epidermidibacterium keratini]|uniref:Lipoprotein n=1 Tax=Epidermidibacterium keratini TaxID=1891644 RepID=A0A7L4YMK5_9ACTN|nr:hypothetical protein [Epidermidibacterium keratini]QHC00049.1 hypothetical protein EK0264_07000 [Epidermidibacterium keratini]